MPISRTEQRTLETYARTLLEAGKAEDRVFENLRDLESVVHASPELLAVVGTMIERGEFDLLPRVLDVYRDAVDADEDVVGVEVTTAVPLDDHLREVIGRKCENDLGKRVFLIEKVDPSIIGGIVLSARGQRRDASVKTQLDAARETLVKSNAEDGGEA